MRTRRLIIALAVAMGITGVISGTAAASIPTNNACYYGVYYTHTASVYPYYNGSNDYSRLTSTTKYRVGYTCSGEPILTQVTNIKATLKYAYPDDFKHTIRFAGVWHDSYSGTGFTLPNEWSPYKNCSGACTVTWSKAVNVLLYYHYNTNNVEWDIVGDNPVLPSGNDDYAQCFLRNTMVDAYCGS
jgi:hypothetical protein